jgi:hypothetical protein
MNMPNNQIIKIDDAIQEISISWRRTTTAILETAKTLQKYNLSANWSEIQEELDKRNIIKISVQKFLLGIANNKVLMNEQYRESLPPAYNTLYHLSTIKSDKLETLLKKETVNPSLLLNDARDLAIEFGEKKKSKAPSPKSPKVIFTITVDSSTGLKTKSNDALKYLIKKFGSEAVDMKINT